MNVQRLLLADGGFPREVIAPWCFVIVANKDAGVIGQRKDFLD